MKSTVTAALVFATVLLLFLSSFLYISNLRKKSEIESYKKMVGEAKDTMKLVEDRLGRQTAKVEQLQGDIQDLVAMKELENQELRKELKRLGKSAQSISYIRVTTRDTILDTQVDTMYIDTVNKKFPTYYGEVESKWTYASYRVNADTALIKVLTHNEFAATEKVHRKGLFGKKYVEYSVKNLNPHTRTEEVFSFRKPVKTRRGVFYIGLGVGILGTALLLK
jgi:hypothetical protein